MSYGSLAGFWLPRQASTTAGSVDFVFNAVTWIGITFFVLITAMLAVFLWKYRARPGHAAQPSPDHNQRLEVTWTVIPVLIVVWIFWEGFEGFLDLATPPKNAYEVQVLGQKWKWLFTYPNGVVDENLHVPPGEPVRLVMTSQDVIHSLYVPEFRIKRDAVPGRYEKQWFQAPEAGEHQIFCAEYCGTSHSAMLAKVIVHRSRPEFERWLADAGNFIDKLPPEKLWEGGEKLYNQRGCKQCHSIDGTSGIGPTFKGIWGHAQPLRGGGSATVDENYVRESIVDPQAKIVAGYEPVMPTFQGRLKDKEITALIEYLKKLD
ncbi:MAG TPA: cytochrome c oxidase subunit II [Candidatus Polarisedimenticolaceae bacterium]|nr:cytochrome c oxidase subunit II [Candidatus Polarisedimenticolaceae bacterium]